MPYERVLWSLLYTLPFMGIAVGAYLYGVAIPFSDDLYMAPYLEKLVIEKEWTPTNILFQLNEHFVVFPLLLFSLITSLFGWNAYLLLFINPLLAAVTVWLVYRISVSSHPNLTSSDQHWLAVVTAALAASLVFWEAWSHAFTINLYLTNTAFLAAIWILYTRPLNRQTLLMTASLCLVASFSAIHGLLTGAALMPLWIYYAVSRKKWHYAAAWVAINVLTITLYLYNFIPPRAGANGANLYYLFTHPIQFFYFFFAVIGAPIFNWLLPATATLGALTLVVIFSTLIYMWHSSKTKMSHLMPWLCLLLFGLGSTFALSLGRAGGDIPYRAAQSRFGLLSYFIIIAAIYISFLTLESRTTQRRNIFILVSACLIGMNLANGIAALDKWQKRGQRLEQGRACLTFYETAPTECLAKLGNGVTDGEKVRQFAPSLKKLGAF